MLISGLRIVRLVGRFRSSSRGRMLPPDCLEGYGRVGQSCRRNRRLLRNEARQEGQVFRQSVPERQAESRGQHSGSPLEYDSGATVRPRADNLLGIGAERAATLQMQLSLVGPEPGHGRITHVSPRRVGSGHLPLLVGVSPVLEPVVTTGSAHAGGIAGRPDTVRGCPAMLIDNDAVVALYPCGGRQSRVWP